MTMSGQEAKEKGNAAFKAGEFAAAIGHYTAAILADPKNATFPLNRAAAYLKLGKNEDADRDCTRVIELDSQNVKAWFRRGQARDGLTLLGDAKQDFERVLQLEPNNTAARQELEKVTRRMQKRDLKLTKKAPEEVPVPGRPASKVPPKRRRVPITIVDRGSAVGSASASSSSETAQPIAHDLLQPVSSRSLADKALPGGSQTPASAGPSSDPEPSPSPSTSNIRKAATFKEAKQAREAQQSRPQSRPGGGIFRSNGQHTLFDTRPKLSSSSAATPKDGSVPVVVVVEPPTPPVVAQTSATPGLQTEPIKSESTQANNPTPSTLFEFNRAWDSLREPEARWRLLQQVPPTSLPLLFKMSLEVSGLVSILQTLKYVLQNPSATVGTRASARNYLINLARVSRFSTVILFMSPEEKTLVRDVWDSLKDATGSNVAERKAWGIS